MEAKNGEQFFGGFSSENHRSSKRANLQDKEDRISDLPDSLIQHILSFLPSTKEAIQTGILSKRWQDQWTRVPVLIFLNSTCKSSNNNNFSQWFDIAPLFQWPFSSYSIALNSNETISPSFSSDPNSDKNFSQFIDTTLTLHDCSKIKKFHIEYDDKIDSEPYLTSKIRFATRKHVEELILNLCRSGLRSYIYTLPKFLFTNASLVKLELATCHFTPHWIINWPRLKELKLKYSSLSNSAFGNVVSGSPLLESLELTGVCVQFPNVVVLKSLKRLIFLDVECKVDSELPIDILCPNLEELSFNIPGYSKGSIFTRMIENVLSGSPLLCKLELHHCFWSERFVIASNSLKKLVLGTIIGTSDYEISCPNLEEVNLYRFMPCEYWSFGEIESTKSRNLAIKILQQLQHVTLLEIGSWFIKNLVALESEGLAAGPLLNCKRLTLDGANFDENFPGILYALRSSPALENLVINLSFDQHRYFPNLDGSRKNNFWNSNEGADFNCSMPNLKNVKIIGFPVRDEKYKFVLNFVEFLLENARMLDRIVIILADCGASVPFEVSTKLLSFQRCFPRTTIELLSST